MTDLERRALLGDAEAQRECTEKGIVLACPICKSKNIVKGVCQSFEYVQCTNCGLYIRICGVKRWVSAIARWNTRPAPPIGRCKDCEHYTLLGHCKIHSQEPDEYGPGAYVEMLPDDFCSYFEPRRPMQPNTNQTITDLQREIRDRRELGQPTAAVVKSLQEMEKEAGHDK